MIVGIALVVPYGLRSAPASLAACDAGHQRLRCTLAKATLRGACLALSFGQCG